MIPVAGMWYTFAITQKATYFKEIRMKNATPSKGGALAQTLVLIEKGEPINLGSVTFLKTIQD